MPGVLTRRPAAPEFPQGLTWWNTDRPLAFSAELKGRVVVLDFWTYCCINCIHILANLEQIERDFRDEPVVVLGVHSNKFANEAEADNIRMAILRYNIAHPVVVDEGHRIWNAYGVSAWPTLVFIDSEGRIAGSVSGEVEPAELERVIRALLDEGRHHGTLAERAPTLRPETMVRSASGLSFPGKILADPEGRRLFIADSGHNRILVTDPAGALLLRIGSGEAGRADGPLERASFHDPQGMAYDAARQHLYIADQGNHLVRRADLQVGRVETVLGTGREAFDRAGGHRGTAQGINSPWDLALVGSTLYIAMAGMHQIWRMDLESQQAEDWVGGGREGLLDGPGFNAALAQPSGLAALGEHLYFADSEVSALRRARLGDGDVETLVGHGLFEFGDADGAYGRARLQHPLGVATDGRQIFIADTYNHKVKALDLEARSVRTVAGSGRPGSGDPHGALELYEPGGLAWMDGKLYIADTNNHRVVVLDPAASEANWHELTIRASQMTPEEEYWRGGFPSCAAVSESAETLHLVLDPALVEGFHVNLEAPCTLVLWEPEGEGGGLLAGHANHRIQCTLHPVSFPVDLDVPVTKEHARSGRLIIDLSFASCTDDQTICKPEVRRWDLGWVASSKPAHEIRLMGGAIGVR